MNNETSNYFCPKCGRPHILGIISKEGSYGISKQEFNSKCHSCGLPLHVIATPAKRSFLFGLIKLNNNYYESIIAYHIVKNNNIYCLKCGNIIPPNLCSWDDLKSGYQPVNRDYTCNCGTSFIITHYDSKKKYNYDEHHFSHLQ